MTVTLPPEAFPTRLRTLRLTNGLTIEATARAAGVAETTWRNWESGSRRPRLVRGGAIASALGVPVAALFRDAVVADVVVSEETIDSIRREGRVAAREAAERLALQLEPAIYAAATRRPVDVSAGARPKPRRSRTQVLAGLREAKSMRAAALNRSRANVIDVAGVSG